MDEIWSLYNYGELFFCFFFIFLILLSFIFIHLAVASLVFSSCLYVRVYMSKSLFVTTVNKNVIIIIDSW